jgi:hypothetical protein
MLKIENKNNKVVVYLDKYSSILLSVIAVCLLLIVVNLYFSPGSLRAYDTVQDVNIKSINGSSLWGNEIPIEIKKINTSSDLNINLKSINDRNIWGDKMPVDIQAINGQFIIGGNLPVNVK